MAGNRRLGLLLGLLAVTMGVALYVGQPVSAPHSAPGRASTAPGPGASTAAEATAPDVHTEVLAEARPKPGDVGRDLFKFKPKYVPAPPGMVQAPSPPAAPSGPPPPPPVPAIPFKFIGVLEPSAGGRIAILSDGRGAPIYGKEGDALLGQYRILRIGTDSIEVEHIDGRGRQAIRLSGS